jgi:hypothetical protein
MPSQARLGHAGIEPAFPVGAKLEHDVCGIMAVRVLDFC